MTPYHERLDPASTFYKHYMQRQFTDKLNECTYQQAAEDSKTLTNIALNLGPKCDCNKCKCTVCPCDNCDACGRAPCKGIDFEAAGHDDIRFAECISERGGTEKKSSRKR